MRGRRDPWADRKIIGAAGSGIGKVPPFTEVVAEALLSHRVKQNFSLVPLFGRDKRARRVAGGIETVESRAHVDAVVGAARGRRRGARPIRRPRIEGHNRRTRARNERKIDCVAARMLGMRSNIAQPKQHALVQFRKKPFGRCFGPSIVCPCSHGVHRPHWTIAVINLQREPGWGDVRLDALERGRGILAQDALWSLVSRKWPADEIVETSIADVLGDRRINVTQIDEALRQSILRSSETLTQCRERGGDDGGPAATYNGRHRCLAWFTRVLPRSRATRWGLSLPRAEQNSSTALVTAVAMTP